MNDDWPIGRLGGFLVDALDEVQHAGRVLGRVEVLPLQVVVVPNRPACLLLKSGPETSVLKVCLHETRIFCRTT
jgi:hypothetical protein